MRIINILGLYIHIKVYIWHTDIQIQKKKFYADYFLIM